mgnify:CR=1 FL=1
MSDNNKKYIIPKPVESKVSISTDAATALDDALGIIVTEIVKYRHKVNRGSSLNIQEARVLQGYIKSLVELSKESRERENNADLANLSDEELANLVTTMLKKNKQEQNNE